MKNFKIKLLISASILLFIQSCNKENVISENDHFDSFEWEESMCVGFGDQQHNNYAISRFNFNGTFNNEDDIITYWLKQYGWPEQSIKTP